MAHITTVDCNCGMNYVYYCKRCVEGLERNKEENSINDYERKQATIKFPEKHQSLLKRGVPSYLALSWILGFVLDSRATPKIIPLI